MFTGKGSLSHNPSDAPGHVYEVAPTGPVFADRFDSGNSAYPEAVMSPYPMRVVRKAKSPWES